MQIDIFKILQNNKRFYEGLVGVTFVLKKYYFFRGCWTFSEIDTSS